MEVDTNFAAVAADRQRRHMWGAAANTTPDAPPGFVTNQIQWVCNLNNRKKTYGRPLTFLLRDSAHMTSAGVRPTTLFPIYGKIMPFLPGML